MRRPRVKSQAVRLRGRGYTLVEVMVAVVIFSTTLVGSLATVGGSWELHRRAQERLYVYHILDSRLEELRDLTFDQIETLSTPITFAVEPATNAFGEPVNAAIDDTDYQIALRNPVGTVHIDTLAADLRRVTVEIAWDQGGKGSQATVRLSTLIARNGLIRQ